ncbi:Crp/Fnr family transcriptional regulator [Chitinophaga solisilvae]|uniref:Crp/Fnr family transcriptional regulator n=1 Tax=Chitinophaga solisilvae TaxID=1233460 RepID=A0A3S1DK80_9BACT|nr:Crp/Fnr family transcriptional regulator [Chitinophaga solisilvae]NSL87934.1 Crp/Fnr family transcriptional regulator [Chitinophaga solisilvae]
MYNIDTLKQALTDILQDDNDGWPLFKDILQDVSFQTGDYLSPAGKNASAIYYLTGGIVRAFTLHDGKDICMDFAFPGMFTCSYASFITQTPAIVSLEAVTPVTGYAFHYENLQDLYRRSHTCEKAGRLIAEQQYLRKYQRELDFLQLSAQERYLQLLRQHPEVVQHIPIKQIASYLGIEPQSLSRIRKNIRQAR